MGLVNRGINDGGVISENIHGNVNIYNTIESKKKLHSLMPKFIEILAEKVNTDALVGNNSIPLSYKIDEKIEYNTLIRYKYIVDDYGNYYLICKSAFEALDNVTVYSKERILRSIAEKYKVQKRLLLEAYNNQDISEIDIIRNHSDDIIDQISCVVREQIMLNYDKEKIYEEDIDFCLPVFLCYAFAECKILERPEKL